MEAPELFEGNYCSQISAEKHHSLDSNKTNSTGSGDHFMVEELLDLSNEDAVLTDCAAAFDNVTGNSTDSSTVTVVHSCGPNFSGDNGCPNFSNGHFSSDLCVPYDDLAELEWLSNIVEESFSCEDLQKLQLISGMKARYNEPSETRKFQPETKANRNISVNPKSQIFNPEMAVPGKPRSKRPRAAPFSWASRLLASASSFEPGIAPPGRPPPQQQSKKESVDEGNGEGRKCLHCANDKTPQWRTGPMGPKTLCNACGVRFKSGRLVPEYRPAASPTFVLTKHSNSHRKVLELRRQKEMQTAQQNVMFDLSNGDDYSIHQQAGPGFR